MKTSTGLLLASSVLFLALQSCQKDTVKQSVKHTNLIVGKWASQQRHTWVYDPNDGDKLVKDTLITFGDAENQPNPWYEIYDDGGNAYITSKPYTIAGEQRTDTTSFMRYTITGSNLTLKPISGGAQTKPIIQLDALEMKLESTYTGTPARSWGLSTDVTYLIKDEVTYKKQ